MDPLELERVNHFVGLNNWEKPAEGDAERGIEAPGERDPACGKPVSGGLNVLIDGAPRFEGMTTSARYREWNERSVLRQCKAVQCIRYDIAHHQNILASFYVALRLALVDNPQTVTKMLERVIVPDVVYLRAR